MLGSMSDRRPKSYEPSELGAPAFIVALAALGLAVAALIFG